MKLDPLVTGVALALLGIAVGAAVAPESLADTYGIPISDDAARSYVRALGARDAVLGGLLLAALRRGNRPALATTLGFITLAGFSDIVVVRSARGNDATPSLLIHVTGALGLVGLTVLVALSA